MATVGFLGLGSMGSNIAKCLVERGHDLLVWNRSKQPVDDLVAHGARAAETPVEALNAPVSFSMLANDEATESVLTPENLRTASGGVHACMASLSPGAADRLASICNALNIGYAATPVLGRPNVARRGELNIIAAGRPSTLSLLQPYLDAVGVRTWKVGTDPRTANIVKIAVNYNIIHTLQALAESVALIERHGGSGPEFVDLLTSTLFGGIVYQGYGKAIAERRYVPAGFSLDLGFKDLRLAVEAAAEVGLTMPTATVLHSIFQAALTDPLLEGADWAAIAEVTRGQTHESS